MMCKVRNPSRRGGWRSRARGAVGRRAAVRGVHDALDQVVAKDVKWFLGCFVCAAWWSLALLFCRSAYAAPSVEIDGNFAGYENNETYNGYVVVDAPNEYIATLTLIGEYAALPQIDSDMYVKLSNESSGGRFYQLVQEWQVMGTNASGTAGNYPTWAGSTYFIDGLNTVYGYGHVWECAITDALKAGAKEDFLTILGGGSLGGGGSPSVSGSFVLNGSTDFYCMNDWINNFSYNGTGWNGTKHFNNFVWTFNINENVQNVINNNIGNYPYVYALCFYSKTYFTRGQTCTVTICMSTEPAQTTKTQNKQSININGTTIGINTSISINTISNATYSNASLSNVGSQTWNDFFWYKDLTGEFVVPEPEPGDNNWPTDDTPQPPSPNPPTPTTPDPDPGPTLPPIDPHDPVIPSPPTNEPVPTGTTPADYTPWLEAILQQLVNLTSYLETCFTWLGTVLDNHCQHIRDHMTTCFNWLGEYEITGMSNLLGEHHTFLNGLAQWIVDNIKWENSGGEFDDSNMIYWLRRIYARQGAGDVNSRPVDPATDYSGFAGWLGVLYDAVALDVSDTSLTALTTSLNGLQHTFPFSLPWDVKQVLQALDVSPVTPSASIPSGTSGVSYDVDLHWMDSAMVSVRAFELLVFIVYVMVHTKDLFGYLMGE